MIVQQHHTAKEQGLQC